MNWQKLNEVETYTHLWDKFKGLFRRRKHNHNDESSAEETIETADDGKFYKIVLDTYSLIRVLKRDKWWMGLTVLVFGVVAAIASFKIPDIYKSSLMLAPEETGNSLSSNISSLASMVGMDMKVGDSQDAIYPEIYPDVVSSTNFVCSLFNVMVTTKDGKLTTTYYDYLNKHQKSTPWDDWKESLIEKLAKSDSTENGFAGSGSAANGQVNPFRLTKKQDGIAKAIAGNINCSVDKKTNVISIEVTDQDPVVAATMCDSVKVRLQKFIIDYRTKKARNDVAYVDRLYKEAKAEYDSARRAYAAYSDAHQDLALQEYQSKQEDLENEMQLKYNIYTQCVQQLQLSRAKLQEKTPVFTVVQQPTVAIKHSNTPKAVIVIFAFALGFFIRFTYILFKYNKEIFRKVEIQNQ